MAAGQESTEGMSMKWRLAELHIDLNAIRANSQTDGHHGWHPFWFRTTTWVSMGIPS